MTKSKTLKNKIAKVRGKGKPAKRQNGRDINGDNLTALERSILNLLLQSSGPVSVKEIAVEMYGDDVTAEAKGQESVRTIRNALRIPKAMDLIKTAGKGKYTVSTRFQKWGFKAAERTASSWKSARDERRQGVSE